MSLRLILMGVSGCGKSSVGEAVSHATGTAYVDGDSLHPPANVEKMKAGQPLADADRWPWLDRVAATLREQAPVMVGCSALKRAYRDHIRASAGGPVRFIHLAGSRELIAQRLADRSGHFMPALLLESQFAALEPPDAQEALTLPVDRPLPQLVTDILSHLKGEFPWAVR